MIRLRRRKAPSMPISPSVESRRMEMLAAQASALAAGLMEVVEELKREERLRG